MKFFTKLAGIAQNTKHRIMSALQRRKSIHMSIKRSILFKLFSSSRNIVGTLNRTVDRLFFTSVNCVKNVSHISYRIINGIPVIGHGFRFTRRAYDYFASSKSTTPLFPKFDDSMSYLVKIKKENVQYKMICVLMLLAVLWGISSKRGGTLQRNYVARIKIHGVISSKTFGEDGFLKDVIEKVEKDKRAVAVIVDIDSPGGSATTSEIVYNRLKRLAKEKPTFAVVTGMAASGGYLVSLACNKIVVPESGIVGSIGVIRMGYEFTELAQKLGIKPEIFKSSQFKASPNPYEKTLPEVATVTQEEIMEIFHWFANLVKDSRKMTEEEVRSVANGRIFIGRTAVKKNLVDDIGDEYSILEQWKSEGLIDKNTRVVDISPPAPKQNRRNVSLMLITYVGRFFGYNIPHIESSMDMTNTNFDIRLQYVG